MAEEVTLGWRGAAKAARAYGDAQAAAAKQAAAAAKQAAAAATSGVSADVASLTQAAEEAIAKQNGLARKAIETGGKDLPWMEKLIFNINKSAPVRLIARNKWKSIGIGIVALGALTMAFRSHKKEMPTTAELTPLAAPPQMQPLETGPLDGMADDKWRQTVAARSAGTAPVRV